MFLIVDSACVCVCVWGGGGGLSMPVTQCVFVIFALLVTDVCWDSETVTSSFCLHCTCNKLKRLHVHLSIIQCCVQSVARVKNQDPIVSQWQG